MRFAGLLAIAVVLGSCGAPAASPPEPRCEIVPAPAIIRTMPNWEGFDPSHPAWPRYTD
jgi:hypothetical protein